MTKKIYIVNFNNLRIHDNGQYLGENSHIKDLADVKKKWHLTLEYL
jgi:hypothetical protein